MSMMMPPPMMMPTPMMMPPPMPYGDPYGYGYYGHHPCLWFSLFIQTGGLILGLIKGLGLVRHPLYLPFANLFRINIPLFYINIGLK
jgi:hypothetical protein